MAVQRLRYAALQKMRMPVLLSAEAGSSLCGFGARIRRTESGLDGDTMNTVTWMFIGAGIALFSIVTNVVPHDWILAMVGGGIFGSNYVRYRAGVR
jgi:hypothetical protein